MKCKFCNKDSVVKKGIRKNLFNKVQKYYCKNCNKYFTLNELRNKTYNALTVMEAVSSYNLGNSLNNTVMLIEKKHKVKVGKSTINNWLNEFKDNLPYYRIRKRVIREYGNRVLLKKKFMHDLPYNFKLHKAKLEFFCKFNSLKDYLINIKDNCPNKFFENSLRCSDLNFNLGVNKKRKYNYACLLANLALKASLSNKKRHEVLEKFMLINDTATIAVEVPVYLLKEEAGKNISGHVDLLQIRYGKIYVLDFKPEAVKENAALQVYLYSLALSKRTKIDLKNFMCGWFDQDNYFEFNPSNVKFNWGILNAD